MTAFLNPTARLGMLVRTAKHNSRFMPGPVLAETVSALGTLASMHGGVAGNPFAPQTTRSLLLNVIESSREMSSDHIASVLGGLNRMGLLSDKPREHLVKQFLRAGNFSVDSVAAMMETTVGLPSAVCQELFRAVRAQLPDDVLRAAAPAEAARLLLALTSADVRLLAELNSAVLHDVLRNAQVSELVGLCPRLDLTENEALGEADRAAVVAAQCAVLPILAERVAIAVDAIRASDASKFFKFFVSVGTRAAHTEEENLLAEHATKVALTLRDRLVRDANGLTADDITRLLDGVATLSLHAAHSVIHQNCPQTVVGPILANLGRVMPDTRAPHLVRIVWSLKALGLASNQLFRIAVQRACAVVQEFPAPLALTFLQYVSDDRDGGNAGGIAQEGIFHASQRRSRRSTPVAVATDFARYFIPVYCTDPSGAKHSLATVVAKVSACGALEGVLDDATGVRFQPPGRQEVYQLQRTAMGCARLSVLLGFFLVLSRTLPRSGHTLDAGAVLMMAAPELSTKQLVVLLSAVSLVPTLQEGPTAIVLLRSLLHTLEEHLVAVVSSGTVDDVVPLFAALTELGPHGDAVTVLSKAMGTLAAHLGYFRDQDYCELLHGMAHLFHDSLALEAPYLLECLGTRATHKVLGQLSPAELAQLGHSFCLLGRIPQHVAEVFVVRMLVPATATAPVPFAEFSSDQLLSLVQTLAFALSTLRRTDATSSSSGFLSTVDWSALGTYPAALCGVLARAAPLAHVTQLIEMLEALAEMEMFSANPAAQGRVVLGAPFFTALAVRLIAVIHTVSPKAVVSTLAALTALGDPLLQAAQTCVAAVASPTEQLLRCLFARAQASLADAAPSDRLALNDYATNTAVAQSPTVVPEARAVANALVRAHPKRADPLTREDSPGEPPADFVGQVEAVADTHSERGSGFDFERALRRAAQNNAAAASQAPLHPLASSAAEVPRHETTEVQSHKEVSDYPKERRDEFLADKTAEPARHAAQTIGTMPRGLILESPRSSRSEDDANRPPSPEAGEDLRRPPALDEPNFDDRLPPQVQQPTMPLPSLSEQFAVASNPNLLLRYQRHSSPPRMPVEHFRPPSTTVATPSPPVCTVQERSEEACAAPRHPPRPSTMTHDVRDAASLVLD